MEPDSLETQALKRYLTHLPREKRDEAWIVLFSLEGSIALNKKLQQLSADTALLRLKKCLLSTPGSDVWLGRIDTIYRTNVYYIEENGEFSNSSMIALHYSETDKNYCSWLWQPKRSETTDEIETDPFFRWVYECVGFDKAVRALTCAP